ncbi:hypothetical protein [Thalassospira sp.]|uniref:hypothetical protein n=1 Tax=Thalassospira sp. TaxID=1912094 RepID=UPI00311D7F52
MIIGIDRNSRLFYEGQGFWGYGVWPTPALSAARFVYAHTDGQPETEGLGGCFFREDHFEATSRIRRGRFYFEGNRQPEQWTVQPHPALPFELKTAETPFLNKEMDTYHGHPISRRYLANTRERPIVQLGTEDRFTLWNIVDVEGLYTGEELVTLKACSSFGILPTILEEKIPSKFVREINNGLDDVADDLYNSSLSSIVDRAREAITQILLAYFDATVETARDLGGLIKQLEHEKRIIAASAAKIVARLHARAKPVEKHKRDLRPLRRQDAELAVQCVGIVLCEVGFGDWL